MPGQAILSLEFIAALLTVLYMGKLLFDGLLASIDGVTDGSIDLGACGCAPVFLGKRSLMNQQVSRRNYPVE